MKCTRCKNEIGNMDTCPYCGHAANQREKGILEQSRNMQKSEQRDRKAASRLDEMEVKLNLLLIVGAANFILMILLLLILALGGL